MKLTVCDRCRSQQSDTYFTDVPVRIKTGHGLYDSRTVDLCRDCYDSLTTVTSAWLRREETRERRYRQDEEAV